MNFLGVKVALFVNDKLLVIQRDDKPGLRFAGLWDFPGGGREHGESPKQCAIREIKEELGIELSDNLFMWQNEYPSMHEATSRAYFLVAKIDDGLATSIKFGDEGQGWKLMAVDKFMASNDVVPLLKDRLNDFLKTQ